MIKSEERVRQMREELVAEAARGPSLAVIESQIQLGHVFQAWEFKEEIRKNGLHLSPPKCRLCRVAFERLRRTAMPDEHWYTRYHFTVWCIYQDFARAHHERYWLKTQTRAEHFALRIKLQNYP